MMIHCLCLLLVIIHCATVHGLTFSVIGDWGLGGRAAASSVEMRSSGAMIAVCQKINCNFTISVGDNIYVQDVVNGLRNSFSATYDQELPIPFFPSVGNHDVWGPQVEYSKTHSLWHFPAHYYSVKLPIDDTGYSVEVFAVDTMDNSLAGGGQLNWLTNSLKNSDARWKFIFGHYPTTGSGRHRRMGSVSQIYRLMDQYNAQVYFCGHDHILEVSNVGGRVLPISGAMARGGMMLRGLGGAFRRWTLTYPGEFNKDIQDWPGHGFITGDLSPNVLTLTFWDQSETMGYELTTTWDWLKANKSQTEINKWPPGRVVRQAFIDEKTLPRGPGGGIAILRSGEKIPVPVNPKYAALQNATPAPTGPPTAAPPTGPPTAAPTVLQPNDILASQRTIQTTAAPHSSASGIVTKDVSPFARYGVSSECDGCGGIPVVNEAFTIHVDGVDLDEHSQLYLTPSVVGCQKTGVYLEGTAIQHVTGNVAVFTVKRADHGYLCLSVDNGHTFTKIRRGDDVTASYTLYVSPTKPGGAVEVTAGDTRSPASSGTYRGQLPPVSPQTSPSQVVAQQQNNAGSSFMAVIAGVIIGVGIGVGVAVWYVKRTLALAQAGGRRERVPTTEMEDRTDES